MICNGILTKGYCLVVELCLNLIILYLGDCYEKAVYPSAHYSLAKG